MEGPGGKIEPDETAYQAIARELKGEMGLVVTGIEKCLHSIQDPGSIFKIEFTETSVSGEAQAIEHQTIGWFTLGISRVPGARSTRTTIVLETVKETPRLPIAKREEART